MFIIVHILFLKKLLCCFEEGIEETSPFLSGMAGYLLALTLATHFLHGLKSLYHQPHTRCEQRAGNGIYITLCQELVGITYPCPQTGDVFTQLGDVLKLTATTRQYYSGY